MASAPQVRLTPEEYVDLEERLGEKHEYHDGQMFAMAGASDAHAVLQANCAIEIGSRIRGKGCAVRASDLRIAIDDGGMSTYPDLSVVCGDVIASRRFRHSCINPTLLVEVLSPSTENYDRGVKFVQYRKLASLREYVLVSQSAFDVEVYRLVEGHWVLFEYRGEAAILQLDSLGIEIPLRDLYSDVRFETEPAA